MPLKVFLSGAGGRTGRQVQQLLHESPEFEVVGLVRRKEQQQQVPGKTILGDIREPATFAGELQSVDALIILSSAAPQKVDKPADAPPGPPQFVYPEGQYPEQIDWEGQKNQIDAATAAGSKVKHIVVVGSMGSEDPDHMLNKLGNGNILVWKRKAEQYAIDSGITYTVINPGGLIDKAGGERELVVGKRDNYVGTDTRLVPRADVAKVVVEALRHPEARNKAFDLVSREGEQTTDFKALFEQTTAGL